MPCTADRPAPRTRARITALQRTGIAALLGGACAASAATDPPANITVVEAPAPLMQAPAQVPAQVPAPVPAASSLPPTMFVGAVAGDELLNLLRAQPRFARVSRDAVGSPIAVLVSQSSESTAGGTASAFATALLTGSTLGLIPMVTNNDLVISYEIAVNGSVLSRYSYRGNFTRVDSIYAAGADANYGLGKEGLAWVKGTVQSFVADAAKDAKLAALLDEYAFYFPAAALPPVSTPPVPTPQAPAARGR